MSEPKRGRPATERGAYNPNPARQLGRVSDEDWETLKAASELAGVPFTQWALPILLRNAKSQITKGICAKCDRHFSQCKCDAGR